MWKRGVYGVAGGCTFGGIEGWARIVGFAFSKSLGKKSVTTAMAFIPLLDNSLLPYCRPPTGAYSDGLFILVIDCSILIC
jgi:hypothetical protein